MSIWIDQKYIGLIQSRLDRFKKKSNSLYNFRCPFCGDSKKDAKKARGFFYAAKDHFAYKCHNCHVSASLYKVLDYIDHALAREYVLETFQNNPNNPVQVEEAPKEYIKLPKSVLEPVGAYPASENKLAASYLISRRIPTERWKDLYFIPSMAELVKINPDYKDRLLPESRILIPFTDWKGNITGVSGRALGQSKKRYVSVRFTNYPLIYGLEHVNLNKKTYILEGAFDSMFVDNAVAAGGSDMQRACTMFGADKSVIIYDNESRNLEIVAAMQKMMKKGFSMVVWPTSWNFKDINEAIISGLDKDSVMRVILNNTYSGLALELALTAWRRV